MNKFLGYAKVTYFLMKDCIKGCFLAIFAVISLCWIGVTGLNCLLTMSEIPFDKSNIILWGAVFAFWGIAIYFIYYVFANPKDIKLKRWIAVFWLAGVVLPLIPGFRMFLDFD